MGHFLYALYICSFKSPYVLEYIFQTFKLINFIFKAVLDLQKN